MCEQVFDAGGHGVEGVEGGGEGVGGEAEARAGLLVGEEAVDGRGEGGGVAGWGEEAGLLGADEFGDTADVGGDDGALGEHRFDEREGEALGVEAGEDEEVGEGEVARGLVVLDAGDEREGDREGGGDVAEFGAVGAGADDEQLGTCRRGEEGDGADQVFAAFSFTTRPRYRRMGLSVRPSSLRRAAVSAAGMLKGAGSAPLGMMRMLGAASGRPEAMDSATVRETAMMAAARRSMLWWVVAKKSREAPGFIMVRPAWQTAMRGTWSRCFESCDQPAAPAESDHAASKGDMAWRRSKIWAEALEKASEYWSEGVLGR